MNQAMQAAKKEVTNFSHFGPAANLLDELESLSKVMLKQVLVSLGAIYITLMKLPFINKRGYIYTMEVITDVRTFVL